MTGTILLWRHPQVSPKRYELEIQTGEIGAAMCQYKTQIDEPTYNKLRGYNVEVETLEGSFAVHISDFQVMLK